MRTKLDTFLLVLAGAAFALLVGELVPRILFPWDLLMFSESTFMTSMMKLTAGVGTYTNPADANSFIYSPGLDYIAFALLRPFGAQLDIRFCRAITVLIGFGAALVMGWLTLRLATLLSGKRRRAPRVLYAIAAIVGALIIFKSFTAEACHPDTLHCLHAMMLIALCDVAVRSEKMRPAFLALAIAALGILAKQTAVLGFAGALAALLYFQRARWGVLRSALLVAWGVVWLALGSFVVFRGWGRYWTTFVPSRQEIEWFRFHNLISHHIFGVPHRFLLVLAIVPCVLYLAMSATSELRKFLAVWFLIGVTEILTSLLGYFKIHGHWNNLIIIDLWMAIPVVAVLWTALERTQDATDIPRRSIFGGVMCVFLIGLLPTRWPPISTQFAFGRALDAAIATDKTAGKRVLVSHGAATLIHNGLLDVPLDRANSAIELETAKLGAVPGTLSRIEGHYYDKIYLVAPAYPHYSQDVRDAINQNYHEVGFIPGDGTPAFDDDFFAIQGLMRANVQMLEANR